MGAGAVALPGSAGANFTEMLQTEPAATTVFPVGSTVQPVIPLMVYSVKLAPIVIEVTGTAVFTVTVTV
jgi:hypothetical protein